jgi:SSS family transporter
MAIVIGLVFKSGVFGSVLIVVAVALFYTFEGGLTAVIWTDVFQLFIYLTGSALALALALHAIPGGWAEVTRLAHAEGNKLAIFNFHFNWHEPYLFWSGLVGGAFLNTATHGTDQLIVQFLLAARNRRQSQAALLTSGVLILLQFTLFLLVGTVLFAFYYHFPPARPFARSDQVFPAFVLTQLPRGLAGLLIAAIIAPGMASLSASFNSLATTSVMDFYKPFVRPNADDKHYLAVSRGMVLGWGGVLVAIALVVQHLQSSVMELALKVASVPYGSMLGIFLLGVLTKRANGRGALTGAIIALVVMVFVVAYTPLAWTWYVALGTVVTFTVGWAVSLATE